MYQQHPLSAAWPAMSDSDFQALKDSINVVGVLNPIVIFEGQVIDGWHRYTASNELGMNCPTVELDETDPVDFVKAMNEARRHLTASQRAIAIVSIYGWRPVGKPERNTEVTSQLTKTNAQLAKEAGVSTKTIEQAKTTKKAGLDGAVRDGAMTVEQASNIAKGKPTKPVEKPEVEEEGAPDQAEFDALEAAHKADEAAMLKLLESDAPLAAMTAECKRLNIVVEQLNWRITGLQNEKNQAISTVKSLQKKLAKLEQAA